MNRIASNLQDVKALIEEISQDTGRQVELLAVSKAQSAEVIREAFAVGQHCFAENYLQEAQTKMAALHDLPIEWHFIGPIQSNKTKPIAESFAWAHSVDREKIARRLAEARPAGMQPLNVCVQVNISQEDTKSGVAPADAEPLCRTVAELSNLRLRGLMTIGDPRLDEPGQRRQFHVMKELFDGLNDSGLQMDTLSMGMTHDMRAAILEGATMVRVGTAIFGARL
ncbi:MAG TPA: YggS family pyridoxal phosphate-dependent enzyme [Burkholderiales bacterium]|nr:YggS family pyridoxal phosphate-dependent enzyme [Burkholderiales bacterium]